MAGIADSHRVIRDVLHHDAAAADDHIAADGHTGQDYGAAMVTPGITCTPAPIQTLSPTVIG